MFDFLNNLFSGKKKNESAVTNDMRQQYVSNADSVFLCYSFNDVDFIAQFLKDMDNEGIRVKTQMDEMDDDTFQNVVLKEIEKAENVLFLATDNAKKSDKVRQCMRLTHDMNKRVLILANYSGSVFDNASWIKSDWNIESPVFYYKNEEQRAQFLTQFKETAGIMVDDGDRVGARVYINVKSNSLKNQLFKGDELLSEVEKGKVGIVRLQKGEYVLSVKSLHYPDDVSETKNLVVESNVGEYVVDFDLASIEDEKSKQIFEKAESYDKNENYSSALTMYKMAANLGHEEAQSNVALYYFLGQGCDVDVDKAISYSKSFAEKGSLKCQTALGLFYSQLENYEDAYHWYRMAADRGESYAQCQVGLFYENGVIVEQNREEAKKWYKLSSDQGDAEGQYQLGMCYDAEERYQEALDLFLRAANGGNADAQNEVGIYYFNGIVVEKSSVTARKWFQKAIEQDFAAAKNNMAYTYEEEQNYDEAIKWYELAANQGYVESEYKLGVYYLRALGTNQDLFKAETWLMKAYTDGNSDVAYYLGEYNSQIENYTEALKYYKQAAEAEDAYAYVAMGNLYSNGQGVDKDVVKARDLYQKAIDGGLVSAEFDLGYSYEEAGEDAEALKHYSLAANAGNVSAQNKLGSYYLNIAENEEEAKKWYRLAAEQNSPRAQCELGDICNSHEEYTEALSLYRKSAKSGYAEAMNMIGLYYESGTAVAKSINVAKDWYKKAADLGYAFAQYNLANVYNDEKAYSLAFSLYSKAAEQGLANAQNMLGLYYDNGTGVGTDVAKAKEYYTLAAEQGLPVACYNLAVTLENEGDTTNALNWYKKSADLGYENANEQVQRLSGSLEWNTSSDEYKYMIADIDRVSAELLKLQDAGVAVLWRPLHEGPGGYWDYTKAFKS